MRSAEGRGATVFSHRVLGKLAFDDLLQVDHGSRDASPPETFASLQTGALSRIVNERSGVD